MMQGGSIWDVPTFDYYLGADFGQANDYTALALVELPVWIPERATVDPTAMQPAGLSGWVGLDDLVPSQIHYFRQHNEHHGRPASPPLWLRHLERMRRVSYQKVVDRIGELVQAPGLYGNRVALLVDHTGVGRAGLDMLQVAGLDPIGITITGGDRVNVEDARTLRVPKRELITATQAALQVGRLRIAAELEDAETLTQELLSYRVKLSAAGHDSYNAREGQHDDTVLAVALAVWYRDWLNSNLDAAHAARQRPRAS